MNEVLQIDHLCKNYPRFQLRDVSFAVEAGQIMGFIGRNGAGKTTTLKSILHLVHPTSGRIRFFGLSMDEHEAEIKSRIGYVCGGLQTYPRKKIKDLVAVTRLFYPTWDDALYRRYLDRFSLDDEKKAIELSEGMKVKLNLAIALSHHAELLLLDEPTSGLDPVSRDDLLEIFLDLAASGTAILFSTHITSDLDKCADAITYIRAGQILASEKTETFRHTYRLIHLLQPPTDAQRQAIQGICRSRDGSTALIREEDARLFPGLPNAQPDLETIMVHLEKTEGGQPA